MLSLAPSPGPLPVSPWLAYLRLTPAAEVVLEEAVTRCRQFSARLELLDQQTLLLDLGACTLPEAHAAVRTLLAALTPLGLQPRAGLGPSAVLAQLALECAPSTSELVAVTPAEAPALLRRVPVSLLPALRPRGAVAAEVVERLHAYGLYTLGQLAPLGEAALRRQFGAAGAQVAAIARGEDALPLQVTPPPAEVCYHLRCGEAAPETVLFALAEFAERVARHLRAHHRQTRMLSIRLHMSAGQVRRARGTLRQPTDDPRILTQELRRLVAPLLPTPGQTVEALRLVVGDFAPDRPEQRALWQLRAQRLALAESLAEPLARRHGHALLAHPRLAAVDAVFPEERYRLVPVAEAAEHGPPSSHPSAAAVDPWQRVPQRLHWW